MADVNRIVISGRLARDPELRHTQQDRPVCNLALAVHRRYTDREGEPQEETSFVEVEAWAQTAEAIAAHLGKGAPALVEGRLREDRFEDREGRSRSKTRVVADNVEFLGSAPSRDRGGAREEEGPRRERGDRSRGGSSERGGGEARGRRGGGGSRRR